MTIFNRLLALLGCSSVPDDKKAFVYRRPRHLVASQPAVKDPSTRQYFAFEVLPKTDMLIHLKVSINMHGCAFLNSEEGGVLYFGVDQDGIVVGTEMDNFSETWPTLEKAIASALSSFSPSFDVQKHCKIRSIPVKNEKGKTLTSRSVISVTFKPVQQTRIDDVRLFHSGRQHGRRHYFRYGGQTSELSNVARHILASERRITLWNKAAAAKETPGFSIIDYLPIVYKYNTPAINSAFQEHVEFLPLHPLMTVEEMSNLATKHCNAFLNSERGGLLFFGVDKKGIVRGFEVRHDDDEFKVLQFKRAIEDAIEAFRNIHILKMRSNNDAERLYLVSVNGVIDYPLGRDGKTKLGCIITVAIRPLPRGESTSDVCLVRTVSNRAYIRLPVRTHNLKVEHFKSRRLTVNQAKMKENERRVEIYNEALLQQERENKQIGMLPLEIARMSANFILASFEVYTKIRLFEDVFPETIFELDNFVQFVPIFRHDENTVALIKDEIVRRAPKLIFNAPRRNSNYEGHGGVIVFGTDALGKARGIEIGSQGFLQDYEDAIKFAFDELRPDINNDLLPDTSKLYHVFFAEVFEADAESYLIFVIMRPFIAPPVPVISVHPRNRSNCRPIDLTYEQFVKNRKILGRYQYYSTQDVSQQHEANPARAKGNAVFFEN